MNKRPLSITIIGWIFIVVGIVSFLYHLTELRAHQFQWELVWICFVRFLAIVAGVCLLRGFNWARWLLVIWIAYHVALSFFHSAFEVVIHTLLLAVIAYFLFRPQASVYFRGAKPDTLHKPKADFPG
jgi:hypothetical protein